MAGSRVAIVGTGYVGLSTAVVLAEKQLSVTCVDRRCAVVDAILAGQCPIHEDGMLEAMQVVSLDATTDLHAAVRQADVVFICVGTPTCAGGGAPDLSQVAEASRQIGEAIRGITAYQTIVVKSTVPPGTTDTLVRDALEAASQRRVGDRDGDVGLAMMPEFLREGVALEDARRPGRVVIGADTTRSAAVLQDLFSPFDVPIVLTTSRTAEFGKYMSNALLATLISFGNDFSNLGAILGNVRVGDALEIMGLDPRWWPGRTLAADAPEILGYLRPGPGFGGSCFPKDLRAILNEAEQIGYPLSMTREALGINERQGASIVGHLSMFFPDGLRGKRFAIWGLAFKPGTDDVRESPAARIVDVLFGEGTAALTAFDPVAIDNYKAAYPHHTMTFTSNPRDVFAGMDGIIIATPWQGPLAMFYDPRSYDFAPGAVVFDTRGALVADRMRGMPCRYVSPLEPFRSTQVQ